MIKTASKMTIETKARLAKIPKSRCFICKSPISHTNPLEKCFECKKRFCFGHLWGGQINEKMKENDEVRKICDKCRIRFDYKTL